jgi:hypothetical protein
MYLNGAFRATLRIWHEDAELRRVRAVQGREINELVRVRLLPLWPGMTTSYSMESTITRKILGTGVVLLAATVAACGGSTQAMTGTAPSQVSSIADATENGGSFSLLKQGKGKGHSPAPELGTPTTDDTPEGDDPEGDGDELGTGHGHGKAAIQLEGFATIEPDTDCPTLTITINGLAVTTVDTPELTTEFQRATCEQLKASSAPSIHLHIAARKMEDDSLAAIYVRMQGPKFGDGEDGDEEEDTITTN